MSKKNILVTGSKGFIGKNLIKKLKENKNIVIYEFTRDSTLKELESYIDKIDFIFHLAGEVRPKSDDVVFREANTTLTQNIIKILEAKKHYIHIIMSSSIHAKLQKNVYGITKREAEILIENYGKKYNVCAVNYRLPHVFGEGCKANYNSVISTWMYNIIRDEEIVIYDRTIPMEYVYVQDIVNSFTAYLKDENRCDKTYVSASVKYNTTLGHVADLLNELKTNPNNEYIPNSLEEKIKIVFNDYLKYS